MAKIGFPAITTPHSMPQDQQLAVNSIRERLQALEAAHQAFVATTQASIQALNVVSTASSSSSSTTTTTTTTATYKAAVNILGGQALYESAPGFVAIADPTILAQSYAIIGIAQSNAFTGGNVTVAITGQVANVPTASFAASYPVFCGPAGALLQVPTYGYPALQVGIALSATTVLIQPDQQLIAVLVNGTTVGYRRAINFLSSGTIEFFADDNPAANRVDVYIGTGTTPTVAPPIRWIIVPPQNDPTQIAAQIWPNDGIRVPPALTPRRPIFAAPQADPSYGGASIQQGGAH